MAVVHQGGVTNDILKAVGREQGPDYMLKLLPELDAGNRVGLTFIDDDNVINMTSSITEVLNVVSYLCSTTRDGTLIDTNNSVRGPPGTNIGAHTTAPSANGTYNAVNGAILNTFIASAVNTNNPLFNITSLEPAAVADAFIPVSILRRTGAAPAANLAWGVQDPHAVADEDAVTLVMSQCIKQMINILVKTREIFGPKGWTDLFQKVKGGGSSRSKNAKRTHRHRRRYSSKQY
jgi:hypothetical protein